MVQNRCLVVRLTGMSELERHLARTIEDARKELGLRPEALCVAAGLSRASYYNRLTLGGWKITELEGIAPLIKVPVESMVKMNCGPIAPERSGQALELLKAA